MSDFQPPDGDGVPPPVDALEAPAPAPGSSEQPVSGRTRARTTNVTSVGAVFDSTARAVGLVPPQGGDEDRLAPVGDQSATAGENQG